MPSRSRTTKPKISENDVEAACLDFLRMYGYYCIRQHCGKFWTWDKMRVITGAKKGTPDWAAMHELYPGFLWEAKRPGAETTEDQNEQIYEIRLNYKLPIVVIDDVQTLIDFVKEREKKWGTA
jgi:hypothetical protein